VKQHKQNQAAFFRKGAKLHASMFNLSTEQHLLLLASLNSLNVKENRLSLTYVKTSFPIHPTRKSTSARQRGSRAQALPHSAGTAPPDFAGQTLHNTLPATQKEPPSTGHNTADGAASGGVHRGNHPPILQPTPSRPRRARKSLRRTDKVKSE